VEISPFPHQGPLDPAAVVGRDALVDDLIERLTERRVTALLGPRRFGKTSVLRRVASDLETSGTSIVWVDAYEVSSITDLALRFDSALAAVSGAVERPLRERAAMVGLTFGVLRAEFSRRSASRPEPLAMLHTLLDTLVEAARREPTVVVFDEFGGVFGVEGAAGLLRTKFQHHFQEIGLVFAGSEPTIMRKLFTRHDMPFYAQADLIEIEPFDAATTVRIVDDGYRATGRVAGPIGTAVYDLTGGHPYRTMQAADAAWRRTRPGQRATEEVWIEARNFVLDASRIGNEALFSSFSSAERSVLRLLAGHRSLFGSDAELLGLSSSSAYGARSHLVDAGVVRDIDDAFRLVDPVFAAWIRDRVGF